MEKIGFLSEVSNEVPREKNSNQKILFFQIKLSQKRLAQKSKRRGKEEMSSIYEQMALVGCAASLEEL